MSNEKKESPYLKGSAREVVFPDGGTLINVDLSLEELQSLELTPGGYVKITIQKRATPDQYGNTHSIKKNTYKPDPNKAKGSVAAGPVKTATFNRGSGKPSSDVPF